VLDSWKGLEVQLTASEMDQLNASLGENPPVPADLFAQPAYRS
jgi:hypothetical protein